MASIYLRQGDTTSVTMELSEALGEHKLKVGIYTPSGKALYETVYPDNNEIDQVDSTHYALSIPYDTTRKFQGVTTLRMAVFTSDKTYVNAGENVMEMIWQAEPVTRKL